MFSFFFWPIWISLWISVVIGMWFMSCDYSPSYKIVLISVAVIVLAYRCALYFVKGVARRK